MTNETDNTREGLLNRLNVIVGALIQAHGFTPAEITEYVEGLLETYEDEGEEPDEPSDGMSDVEADADTLRSAGMGTDEDYYHDTPLGDQYEGD